MTLPALGEVRYLRSEFRPQLLPPSDAEVAFAGRSNVGKSSLLNALARRDVAKVSSTPGRTRTLNVFEAGAPGRWLVDLPGYGFAEGSPAERKGWAGMIEGYLTGRPSLRAVFALVDAKVGPTKLDLEMLRWLQSVGAPWRVVATKADQVKSSQAAARRRQLAELLGVGPERLAWTSADTEFGIPELRREIAALLQP